MTTWKLDKIEDIEKYIRQMIISIKKSDREVIISSDFASGSTYAPSSKRKNYRSLPFALSPDAFTTEGNNNFIMGNCAGIAFFILPKGSVKKIDKKNDKNNIDNFFQKENKDKGSGKNE